jgi:hypothetical protein
MRQRQPNLPITTTMQVIRHINDGGILTLPQDVGAMRFPGSPYMDRVIGSQNWSLVSYLNSQARGPRDRVDLIPYIFSANGSFSLYNNVLVNRSVTPSASPRRRPPLAFSQPKAAISQHRTLPS